MKCYRCPQCGSDYDAETACPADSSEGTFPGEPNEVFFDHEGTSDYEELIPSRCCPQCGTAAPDSPSQKQ